MTLRARDEKSRNVTRRFDNRDWSTRQHRQLIWNMIHSGHVVHTHQPQDPSTPINAQSLSSNRQPLPFSPHKVSQDQVRPLCLILGTPRDFLQPPATFRKLNDSEIQERRRCWPQQRHSCLERESTSALSHQHHPRQLKSITLHSSPHSFSIASTSLAIAVIGRVPHQPLTHPQLFHHSPTRDQMLLNHQVNHHQDRL